MKTKSEDKLELPPEIWTEVLARLPVKTLVRCRCVCKSWLSFIDNPDFISMHLTLFNNNKNKNKNNRYHMLLSLTLSGKLLRTHSVDGCTFRKSGDIFEFPSSVRNGFCVDVQGYVNGLMLISWSRLAVMLRELVLVNPSIMKCLTLPPCPVPITRTYPLDVVLLGIDPCSTTRNDYKVVVLNPSKSPSAAIYELNKGCWRTINKNINFMQGVSLGTDEKGVFCEGAVHWIPRDNKHKLLVSFDFGSETLSYKDLPSWGDANKRQLVPFILGDSVAIFEQCYDEGCFIWVMRGDSDEWRKCYSGDWTLHEEDLIDELFYVEQMDMLLVFDFCQVSYLHIKDKQIKEMRRPHSADVKFVDTYVESLVLASGSQGQNLRRLSGDCFE